MLMLENFDVQSQPVAMVIAQAQAPQVDPRPRVLMPSLESVAATATQNSVRPEKSAITPAIIREIEKALNDSCASSENPSYVDRERKAMLAMLSPGTDIGAKLKFRFGITAVGGTSVKVVQAPKNGRISSLGYEVQPELKVSAELFEYTPNWGFLGDDHVVFETIVSGKTFRLRYIVRVVHGGFSGACDDIDEQKEREHRKSVGHPTADDL